LIVRTARGVRMVDLGLPPAAIVDANGNVTNANLSYIDDCNYIPVGPDDFWKLYWNDPRDLLTNPVDWVSYMDALHGLDVQLVTLSKLEPGELIQFRSQDHRVDVTADSNGQAIVPVMLPLTEQAGSAMLMRANRRNIEGHFSIDSVAFQRQASLPAGLSSSLVSGLDGTATLTTKFADHFDVHEIGSFGAPIFVGSQDLPESSRHISDLKLEPDNSMAGCEELPSVVALHRIPGFADAKVAIAETLDGSLLVLDLNEGVRVAGTFEGPIGAFDVCDNWGVIAGARQTTIYRVSRTNSNHHSEYQSDVEQEAELPSHHLSETAV
jgi:hypothetical protein